MTDETPATRVARDLVASTWEVVAYVASTAPKTPENAFKWLAEMGKAVQMFEDATNRLVDARTAYAEKRLASLKEKLPEVTP